MTGHFQILDLSTDNSYCKGDQMTLEGIDTTASKPSVGSYIQSLYQLVPTEITAAYMAIYSSLNPFANPYIDHIDYVLFGSIFVLMVLNFLFFGIMRGEARTVVKIYMSATFLVWVAGTSVDYWTGTIPGNMPPSFFLVLVILWAVGSVLFLKWQGIVAKNA